MSSKSTAVVRRATAFIENLEERRLMSAALTLVNPLGIPSNSRLIFNKIQNPDTTVPNVTHLNNTLQLKNTGDSALLISSLTLSGPFAFVNAPAGNYAGTSIAPGQSLSITITFTQSTEPAHSVNETNFTTDPNGGAAITGSLTIASNSAANPSQSVTLAGYWQNHSESNDEPNLPTIVNTVAGYTTTIVDPYQPDLNETADTAKYYGQEVKSDYWSQASTSSNVSITQLAAFHTEGNVVHTYWYPSTTQTASILLSSQANQAQSLLPTFASGAAMTTSFNPNGNSFGFKVDTEYSTDAINVAKNNTSSAGHHFRFYPLIDSTGAVVANTYIMAMDYAITQTENYDFQDNVYLVSNIIPSTSPPAPTNLAATSATTPALSWSGVTYSNLAGYNVYRSTTAGGSFTKLTSAPITGTSYTDLTAPSGSALYYRVTAVDSTNSNESAPATATANTPAGPVAVPDTFSAITAVPTTLNVLANDTDAAGSTLTASSVTLTSSPNHSGTATVDPATGAITYTSAASFTGTESFTYTVADNRGLVSSAGTVTVNVGSPSSVVPVASNDTAYTLAGAAVNVAVLSNDTVGGSALVPSTVAIKSNGGPSHGTAAPDAGTGNILYTPAAGFVGNDSFSYNVTDANGNTVSAKATVYVGVAVGTNSNKSITYKDGDGTTGVITLKTGVANVYFAGNGTVGVAKGKANVTGTSLAMANIALTGTNASSVLTIKSAGNAGTLNLSGITDDGTMGRIIAPSTAVTGVINTGTISITNGMTLLSLKSLDTAQIGIGSSGVANFSLVVAGGVAGSDLSSGVVIKQIKAASWTNSLNNIIDITAPAISNLTIAGEFQPSIDVTGSGSTLPALGNVKIGGAVDQGYWNIQGPASNLTFGAVSNAWGATITDGLNKLTVRKDGLPANISAATFGTINVTGDLDGSLTAGSAKTIKVTGNMSGGALTLTNSAGTVLNSLKVSGTISGSTVTSAGNIGTITANALVSSTVIAGPSAALTLAGATTANIGSDVISSIKLAGKGTTGFSDSTILADTISSASLGPVNTSNVATSGIGAATISKLMLTVAGKSLKLTSAQLANQAAVDAYVASQGAILGNFEIRVI